MKIVLVSQEYPPETAHGGIASQTFLKAQGLARLGHEVTVLSHSVNEQTVEALDGSVRVIRIPGSGPSGWTANNEEVRWLVYSQQVAKKLIELGERSDIDLIDFVEWGAEGFFYLLNRPDWDRVPCVVHIQGPLAMLSNEIGWPDKDSEFFRVGSFMEGTCLRLADAVYSSSRYSALWCQRSYALSGRDIPAIHAGIDTRHFFPRPVPKSECPTILFVGRIAESKGVLVLFEAALKLAREIPTLRLRMIGRDDNGMSNRMKKKAESAGFPDLLEVTGFVAKEELPDHLSRAHVFAAPSYCEGGPGFVYLEAMACGLPVIGCEGSGVAEVIQHGTTGFLVPPKKSDTLLEPLKALLTDPLTLKRLSENARRYVLEEADTNACVKNMETLYQRVLTEKKQALS